MEEQGRQHTITPALNRELLILNIPRVLLLVSAGIGLGVFIFTWSFVGTIIVFLLLCVISYWLAADDPAFPAILASALRHHALYDPFEYQHYDLRWKQ